MIFRKLFGDGEGEVEILVTRLSELSEDIGAAYSELEDIIRDRW